MTETPRRRGHSRWLELSIHVPSEYVEPVAELFRRYGHGGVVIEEAGGYNPDEGEQPPTGSGATLRAYIPATTRYQRDREMLHIGVALVSHIQPLPPLQEREMAEPDWEEAWKAHFTPLHIGQRLVVLAPFHAGAAKATDVPIIIDPGLAFGTGHHPTTRRCLESLDRLVTPGSHVLDVGTGSGILAIAAAKLGAGRVTALETDQKALRVGRANVRANGVSRVVRCYPGTIPHPKIPPGSADLIVANIHAKALIELAPALRDALKPGGWLMAAGVLQDRQAGVEAAFGSAGLQVRETLLDDDWVALLAR